MHEQADGGGVMESRNRATIRYLLGGPTARVRATYSTKTNLHYTRALFTFPRLGNGVKMSTGTASPGAFRYSGFRKGQWSIEEAETFVMRFQIFTRG